MIETYCSVTLNMAIDVTLFDVGYTQVSLPVVIPAKAHRRQLKRYGVEKELFCCAGLSSLG